MDIPLSVKRKKKFIRNFILNNKKKKKDNEIERGSEEARSFLVGSYHYSVQEIEVYQIEKPINNIFKEEMVQFKL